MELWLNGKKKTRRKIKTERGDTRIEYQGEAIHIPWRSGEGIDVENMRKKQNIVCMN